MLDPMLSVYERLGVRLSHRDVFTLAAGRCVLKNGRECLTIKREETTRPVDADDMTRLIVALLNEYAAAMVDVAKAENEG